MCEIEEQQIIERFIKIVSGANNRIVSTRLNEKYFITHNIKHIWDAFNQLTDSLGCEIGDRLIFVKAGYIKERPKCIVCGNPVTISDRKVFKYCCKQCAAKDPDRSKKYQQPNKIKIIHKRMKSESKQCLTSMGLLVNYHDAKASMVCTHKYFVSMGTIA